MSTDTKTEETFDTDDFVKEEEGTAMDYTELIKQCTSEWDQGWWHLKPKWEEWALRLKLYNNQKRDKDSVGDTTLFTIFQTVLASLYEDRLSVTFGPREVGDDESAENLSLVAEYDYDVMEKDVVDYEWDWETCFYGRGLLCTMEWDKDTKTPAPIVWNAMTVVRDPEAGSVNGDRKGRGRSRFLYRETRLTSEDLKDTDLYFNTGELKPSDSLNSTKSPLDEYARMQAEAAGLTDMQKHSNVVGDNATYRVREGFTRYKGKVVFVTLADDGAKVIRYQELEGDRIPVVDRVIFPIPSSWDSVSIPDLVEDKQRARATALNLSIKTVKAGLHPMYLYDKTKIDERTDFNFAFNKFIGVNGNPNGAVVPLMKDTVKSDVSYIMDTLDTSAQRATATPDVKQGSRPGAQSTATRDQLVSQGSDTRYSLAARIFGWSEKRFWQEYYRHIHENLADGIEEKSARIVGSLGAVWRPFAKKDLITPSHIDPDIKIESRTVAEARRFNEAQLYRDYLKMAIVDPTAQIRPGMRHYGKLIGLKTDVIEQVFPPTIDELQSEDENKEILANRRVNVLPNDDHYTHMQIHNKLPDSPVKNAHIEAHKKALVLQKFRPDLVPPAPGQPAPAPGLPGENLPQPAEPRKLPTGL